MLVSLISWSSPFGSTTVNVVLFLGFYMSSYIFFLSSIFLSMQPCVTIWQSERCFAFAHSHGLIQDAAIGIFSNLLFLSIFPPSEDPKYGTEQSPGGSEKTKDVNVSIVSVRLWGTF